MKTFNIAVLSLALAAGMAVASDADARGGHRHHHHGARFGVFIGAPIFPYAYYHSPYYYPRYYYPPAVVAAPPPVYIEQNPPPPAVAAPAPSAQGAYWYFCQDTQTYYPYVQQCASPWQQVIPQASAPAQ